MYTIYKEENDKLVTTTKSNDSLLGIKPNSWLSFDRPSVDFLKKVSKKTKLNLSFLMASIDAEESARIDKDDDGSILIVLDVPLDLLKKVKKKDKQVFETIPFVIVYNADYFVTITRGDCTLINSFLTKVKKIEPHKHARMVLNFLFRLAQQYIVYLKMIDVLSKEIESKLHTSMKNQELFDLMSLSKMLVYFSTALNSDKAVSEKLKRLPEYKKYEDDFDLMEDVQVEFDQAIEMCSIYRDILAGMMDAFASIISNNLNIVMKILAIITIVLSIPTIIASFWGMNVDVPFKDNQWAFWIIVVCSIAAALIGGVILLLVEKKRK